MATTLSNHYSDEFKEAVVREAQIHNNISEAARNNGVHVNTVRKWKRDFEGKNIFFTAEIKSDEIINENRQSEDSSFSAESVQQLNNLVIKLQKEIEQLTNDNKQLQKELLSSQQHIGRMFMENERLKEKAANRSS